MNDILDILIFPRSVKHDYVVVAFAAALLIICFITSYYCGVFNKVSSPIKKENTDWNYRATVRSFQSFFTEVLPMEFQYKTAVKLFAERFSERSFYNILTNTARDGNKIKFNKWLSVIMKILCILSTNVAIAIVFYPMQRNCQHRSEHTNCVAETTVTIIGSLCTWDESSQTCSDSSANNRLPIVVIILFTVTLITSFTDKFMTFALTHAIVAMKNKRMSWLYCCFIRSTTISVEDNIHPVTMLRKDKPQEKRNNNNKRSNKVVPFDKVSSFEDADIDNIGTDRSIIELESNNNNQANSTYYSRVIKYLCSVFSRGNWKKQPTIALPSSLPELLQVQERQLQHYGDELTALHVQTRKTTMLRAARITIMRASIDYVSATQEAQYMLTHNRERYLWMETPDQPLRSIHCWDALWRSFRLRQLKFFDWGDPTTALELMHLAHLEHHDLIEHRLRRTRQRASEIRAALLKLPNDDHRDCYLLQAFLVNSLSGHKRVIARSLFFESAEIEGMREDRVIWQYFALLTVLLYLIVTIGIIFYAGLSITGPATTVCVVCIVLSLVLELVYLQPTVIWLLRVWAPGTAKKDILALHWILQARAQSLLGRRIGLLNSVNALVQHFHPACRAARLLPHLPIARLLLSLSDHDLPVRAVLQRLRRRQIYYPKSQVLNTGSPLVTDRCEAICINTYSGWRFLYNIARTCSMAVLRLLLHGLYILPVWLREVVVEVGCAAVFLGLLLLLNTTMKSDPSGGLTAAVIIVFLLGLTLAVYKAYRDIHKEKMLFSRLERQRVSYDLHCNPITNQQHQQEQKQELSIASLEKSDILGRVV